MHRRQRTIRTSKSCKGVGLHTGVDSIITFHPAPENYGVRFVRSDIKDSPEIKADIDHVVDISRGTTIEQNDVRIHTVEHALAAVNGLRIDNVMIELNNKETPVMDGSAKDFVDALLDAGIKKQEAKRKVLKITRAVNYTDYYRDIDIHVIPSDNFRVTFLVEYPLPALGTQYEAIYNMEEDFAFEVAPARTFCFLSEIEMLKEQGLIKGGALDNALVIIDKKIDEIEINRLRDLFGIEEAIAKGSNGLLNGKILRFKNEPVRHKTLDLIGDMALLGVPIIGHITAARAGHASNVEFVKKLKKVYAKELEELALEYKVDDTKEQDSVFYLEDVNQINRFCEFLKTSETDKENRKDFVSFVNAYDKRRNKDFTKTFPEFVHLLKWKPNE